MPALAHVTWNNCEIKKKMKKRNSASLYILCAVEEAMFFGY